MKKYFWTTIFFLVLVGLTYFFVLKDCDINLIIASFNNTNQTYLFLTFLTMFVYVFLGAFFIKRLLGHFKYPTKLSTAYGYLFTEIYFSSITPSYIGGQPVQVLEMKKEGIPYEISSVVVLFNSMINRIALILVATILFIFFGSEVFAIKGIYNVLVILGYLTAIMVIGIFFSLIYSQKVTKILLKITFYLIDHLKFIKNKEELKEKLEEAVKNYQTCSKITKNKPLIVVESLIILVLQRLCLLLASYTVYRAFGLSQYGVFLIMAFQICVNLGSDLMPTPGGVIANEGLLLVVNNLLYGEALALSGMLMLRCFNFYFLVLISAIGYFIFHYRKKLSKSLRN